MNVVMTFLLIDRLLNVSNAGLRVYERIPVSILIEVIDECIFSYNDPLFRLVILYLIIIATDEFERRRCFVANKSVDGEIGFIKLRCINDMSFLIKCIQRCILILSLFSKDVIYRIFCIDIVCCYMEVIEIVIENRGVFSFNRLCDPCAV